MSQQRFMAGLQSNVNADRNRLQKEWDKVQSDVRDKKGGSATGRLYGAIGGTALAALALGMGPIGMGILAGMGSRAGSEIGEHYTGEDGQVDAITLDTEGYTYGQNEVDAAAQDVIDSTEGFGIQQTLQAGSDAWSAYKLGGAKDLAGNAAFGKGGVIPKAVGNTSEWIKGLWS